MSLGSNKFCDISNYTHITKLLASFLYCCVLCCSFIILCTTMRNYLNWHLENDVDIYLSYSKQPIMSLANICFWPIQTQLLSYDILFRPINHSSLYVGRQGYEWFLFLSFFSFWRTRKRTDVKKLPFEWWQEYEIYGTNYLSPLCHWNITYNYSKHSERVTSEIYIMGFQQK